MSKKNLLQTGDLSRREFLAVAAAIAGTATLEACASTHIPIVQAIKFNHDPTTSRGSALNIRINYALTVDVPEWMWGEGQPAQSPVAYSIQDVREVRPTVKVKFGLVAPSGGTSARPPSQVEFQATGGGVLGALDPQLVNFSDRFSLYSVPEFVDFPFNHHTIGTGGIFGVKREDIEWQWMYRLPGETTWRNVGNSRHRVYIVLREPQGPWTQQPYPNDQNPWTNALNVACSIQDDPGSQDDPLDRVAYAIGMLINPENLRRDGENTVTMNPARLRYSADDAGTPHYTEMDLESTFNLSAFLERWSGREGAGPLVNCSDCACIMTTLANLLGCNLWEGQMYHLALNPVMPIGTTRWWLPIIGFISIRGRNRAEELQYHEVAWKDAVAVNSLVYDACYRVNWYSDPEGSQSPDLINRLAMPAFAMKFRDPDRFDYSERLINPVMASIVSPNPHGVRRAVR